VDGSWTNGDCETLILPGAVLAFPVMLEYRMAGETGVMILRGRFPGEREGWLF
jgi:hypothetical protein